MTDATAIAEGYIATWNERHAARRKELLARFWTDDARYADPLLSGAGGEAIGGMIGQFQDKYAGFSFELTRQPQQVGDTMRFSWGFGPSGEAFIAEGTDFATLRDGRLGSVTGFFDRLPETH